jgi:hypothetical protein
MAKECKLNQHFVVSITFEHVEISNLFNCYAFCVWM